MGFLDRLKARLGPAKDKAAGLAQQHGDKIEQGLSKAARTVDEKTKGKYSDKIQGGTDKAKDALGRLSDKGDGGGDAASPGGGGTSGPSGPAAS